MDGKKGESAFNALSEDGLDAVLVYQSMCIRDRIEALLYLVDEYKFESEQLTMTLRENFTPIFLVLKEANDWVDDNCEEYNDELVIDKAVELYNKKYMENSENEIENLPEEVKEERKNKFYNLL